MTNFFPLTHTEDQVPDKLVTYLRMTFLLVYGRENISKENRGAEFRQKGRSWSVVVLVEFSFQETWISQHQMQTLIPKITNLQGKKL